MTDLPKTPSGLSARRMRCDDVPLLAQWYLHPEISSTLLDETCTEQSMTETLVRLTERDPIEDCEAGFVLELDSDPIGFVHLMWINWISRTAEIDFFIDPFKRRTFMGIMALRQISDLAFDRLNLRKLYGFIYGNNQGSLRLLSQWMTPEATLKRYLKRGTGYVDVHVMVISVSSYRSLKGWRHRPRNVS